MTEGGGAPLVIYVDNIHLWAWMPEYCTQADLGQASQSTIDSSSYGDQYLMFESSRTGYTCPGRIERQHGNMYLWILIIPARQAEVHQEHCHKTKADFRKNKGGSPLEGKFLVIRGNDDYFPRIIGKVSLQGTSSCLPTKICLIFVTVYAVI
jgi:hypothetical protein